MIPPRWLAGLTATAAALALLTLTACGGPTASAIGQRVEGTTVSTGAPLISSGDYWDEVGSAGTDAGVRVYALERATDQDLYVSVTAEPRAGVDDGLEVTLKNPAGDRCGSRTADGYASSREPLMSATVAVSVRSGDACRDATRLLLTVQRTGEDDRATRIRMRVTGVAGVQQKQWPTLNAEGQPAQVNVGPSTPGSPGEWLSDAGVLGNRQTVSGEIGTSALHTYQIPVQWGQGLQVQLVFPDPSPTVQQETKDAGLQGGLYLVNAAGEVGNFQSVYLGPGGSTNVDLAPVHYASSRLGYLPGNYVLVVALTSEKETQAVIPYQLVASVHGSVNNGLGPQVVMSTPNSQGLPEPVLWGMLVLGVLLIIAGMAQVTMSRQRQN